MNLNTVDRWKLSDIIVFDIIDELTDEKGFDSWWFGLGKSKQNLVTKVMSITVVARIEQLEVEIIVFDILDELTDKKGFDAWWHGLGAEKRNQLTAVMSNCISSNIRRQLEVDAKYAAIGGTGGCQSS